MLYLVLNQLNEDLVKLADTEEQRVGIQNLIDYQKDTDKFNKRFANYKYLTDQILRQKVQDMLALEKSLFVDLGITIS